MKTAVAIKHVHFEDLGSFEAVLASRGHEIQYTQAGRDDIAALKSRRSDLLSVLGGPIGAYPEDTYPFLKHELQLIETRLTARRPVIRICFGAQLIARALGARAFPAQRKELGWSLVTLTDAGGHSPLRHFEHAPVLYWHRDTFDLPKASKLLASMEFCENQAFSLGDSAIGIQFHPEAISGRLEEWFIGHACEIGNASGVSVNQLRDQSAIYGAELLSRAREFLAEWLSTAEP